MASVDEKQIKSIFFFEHRLFFSFLLQMEEGTGSNENRHHDNSYVSTCVIRGAPIVSLITDGKERLCLAQISNDLLKDFSYNEIHNRRVGA